MQRLFADMEHLLRIAGLFVVGIVIFLVARAALVPEGFGKYGHYRAGAIQDNMEPPLVFAGRAACADCHDEMAEQLAGGGHRGVGCESCHGALGLHAQDPAALEPLRPEPALLCPVCHEQSATRPAKFPQVEIEEHAGGASCGDCHEPHAPGLS